jgi:hypothetical protein
MRIPAVLFLAGRLYAQGTFGLWDDVREWTATEGTACHATGVNLPVDAQTRCAVNSATRPESGIEFPDISDTTNCVHLRSSSPPDWDKKTKPGLLLTATQIEPDDGHFQMTVGTWHIAQDAAYDEGSYVRVLCTPATGSGDMRTFNIICRDLDTTGAGPGRSVEYRICRDGEHEADTAKVAIRVYESKVRWTLTSACASPPAHLSKASSPGIAFNSGSKVECSHCFSGNTFTSAGSETKKLGWLKPLRKLLLR